MELWASRIHKLVLLGLSSPYFLLQSSMRSTGGYPRNWCGALSPCKVDFSLMSLPLQGRCLAGIVPGLLLKRPSSRRLTVKSKNDIMRISGPIILLTIAARYPLHYRPEELELGRQAYDGQANRR